MTLSRLFYVLLAVAASSCSYEAFGGAVTCEQEGAVSGDRRCENGVWVTGPSDSGAPRNNNTDAGNSGTTPDSGDCVADTEAALCAANSATCGTITVTDNCGNERDLDCGTCEAPETCGADVPNQCGCTAETDADLCAASTLNCGDVTLTDRCGAERAVNCGSCTEPATCGGGGTANVCGCDAESDADFCQANGAQCGVISAVDECGQMRTVDCETCNGCTACPDGETCAAQGTANQCECTPETDAEFCDRQGKDCGAFSGTDNCGNDRTNVLCGACDLPATCGGGGDDNVCGCSPQTQTRDICEALGPVCGTQNADSVCPGFGDIDCGSLVCGGFNLRCLGDECACEFFDCDSSDCFEGQRCHGSDPSRFCYQGSCCEPDSETDLCDDNGFSCGTATVPDNCGQMRQIDCGSCDNGTCMNNTCNCDPANDCPEYGCGTYRPGDCDNQIDCGGCGDAQTCNSQFNYCVCDDCRNSACDVGQTCGFQEVCQSDGSCDN